MERKTEIKTLVPDLNKATSATARTTTGFEMIRSTLAGLAERYAADLRHLLASLRPALASCSTASAIPWGKAPGDDAFDLVDYGIAALDLRAPEDPLIMAEIIHSSRHRFQRAATKGRGLQNSRGRL